jgi:hypothetical protein
MNEMPDDTDHEGSKEEEYKLWKERELNRLRVVWEEKQEKEKSLKEIEER